MDQENKGKGKQRGEERLCKFIDLLEKARTGWASWLCCWFCRHGFGKLLIFGSEGSSHGRGSSPQFQSSGLLSSKHRKKGRAGEL